MPAARPLVVLPSCAFPRDDADDSRQDQLRANLRHVARFLPDGEIVVADNGMRPPALPEGGALSFDRAAFSPDPSIGECRNLLRAIAACPDDRIVLKLHARCPLTNFPALLRFWRSHEEFVLVNRNLFGRSKVTYDRLPFADTRVFALRAGRLRTLLGMTLASLETHGGRIERALLAAIIGSPAHSEIAVASGSFYPVLAGVSGHGRDYSAPLSSLRGRCKSVMYRFGL